MPRGRFCGSQGAAHKEGRETEHEGHGFGGDYVLQPRRAERSLLRGGSIQFATLPNNIRITLGRAILPEKRRNLFQADL